MNGGEYIVYSILIAILITIILYVWKVYTKQSESQHTKKDSLHYIDFNDKSLSLEYILSDAFINASIAAFNELKLTSIYEETNGAILVVLLPVFKKVLPEYYEALNFENCSLDDQIKDFEQVMAMVERLQASSILDALRNNATPVDFDLAVEDVKFLMDKVLNIKLFADGSLEAVTELLLRDLSGIKATINGKEYSFQTNKEKRYRIELNVK